MEKLGKLLARNLMTFGCQRLMDAASDVTEAGLDNVPQGTNVNYVRVIGSDGESYKIEREAFMGLIRDALPAVLSNLNGNIAQVFGKAANGGMGYETIQSLAAVLGASQTTRLTAIGRTYKMERGGVYIISQSSGNTLYFIKPGYTESATVKAKLGNNAVEPFTLTFDEQNDRATILTVTGTDYGNIVIKQIL